MGVALFLIGFLAIIAGIVMFIVALVRRSGWGVARSLVVGGGGLILAIVGIVVGVTQEATKPGSTPSPAPQSTQPLSQLITKDASQFVLAISDFEPGWTQVKSEPTTKQGAQSAYHSYFFQGTFYPSVVQNTVAVYPSIDSAQQVYLNEKPQNVSLEYPKIGDECFINTAVDINKLLVFRKSNVIVWIWLQQAPFDDIKPYAKIVEGKIR